MRTPCQRCGDQEPLSTTCSYFDTDQICDVCAEKERRHPLYEEARRVETEACRRGDFNFAGIGLPPELAGGSA